MPAVSLKPSDAQAGGFLDDADVLLKELRFVVWDYNGKANPSVALKVTMEEPDIPLTHEQYYSAGDPSKWQPTSDGKSIEPLAGATGLNQNTNVIAFITSLVNAGFPEDRLGEDVSIFDGTLVHVNQIAQPKRPGLKRAEEKEKTYLLVTRIVRLPWEAAPKPQAKGAPKPTAQPTLKAVAPVNAIPHQVAHPAPSPAPDTTTPPSEDVVQKARETVVAILAEKGGALPKAKLTTEVFRALTNDPDRNAVVMVIFQESFLQSAKAEGVFAYDGTTVTLG